MLNSRLAELKSNLASKYPIDKIITSYSINYGNSPATGIKMEDSVIVDPNDVPDGFDLVYYVLNEDMGFYFTSKPPLEENYLKFFAAIFESMDNGNKED